MGTLTDVAIRNWIKSGERFDSRSDGDGLYLAFHKDHAVPVWRFRYRFAAKARGMHLGSYRDLPLADARRSAKESCIFSAPKKRAAQPPRHRAIRHCRIISRCS